LSSLCDFNVPNVVSVSGLSSSCGFNVLNVVSVSGLSFLECPFGFL
jgi:hypothetical protein